jgi:hypothetical protein
VIWLTLLKRETSFGVRLAEELRDIEPARPLPEDEAYPDLRHDFARTPLTARPQRAAEAMRHHRAGK